MIFLDCTRTYSRPRLSFYFFRGCQKRFWKLHRENSSENATLFIIRPVDIDKRQLSHYFPIRGRSSSITGLFSFQKQKVIRLAEEKSTERCLRSFYVSPQLVIYLSWERWNLILDMRQASLCLYEEKGLDYIPGYISLSTDWSTQQHIRVIRRVSLEMPGATSSCRHQKRCCSVAVSRVSILLAISRPNS